MEIQTVEQEIEILREITTETERIKKTCGEIPCGFYGAEYTEDLSMSKKKLSTVIILCLIFMSIEIVGGIKSHSLAVLTGCGTSILRCCLLRHLLVFPIRFKVGSNTEKKLRILQNRDSCQSCLLGLLMCGLCVKQS
ncbi:unnamed protein product [Arabidopsis arenosa]|uniref:Uncharacterized protein n=1 Tax=Arabidopsis arenosa TaxID=38785 RepID=A0A8S1ZGS5_ARAAE|nr:unnamed protein product [Arabidopsis arenosa]